MNRKLGLCSLTLFFLFLFLLPLLVPSKATSSKNTEKEGILDSYGRLPLYFIENKGQIDPKVRFYVKTSGQTLYFTDTGIVFDLLRGVKVAVNGRESAENSSKAKVVKTERLVFKLVFENAQRGISMEGLDRQEAKINCFVGNDKSQWKRDIPTYKGVFYKGVYKGIDLKVYGKGKDIEYEFIVNPGSNPNDIRLTYNGIEGLSKNQEGELLIETAFGKLKETRPHLYQVIEGERNLEGNFEIYALASQSQTGKFSYGFKVASYNPTYPLIIDPVLSYSTYLGGSDNDFGKGIAVDVSGNAYIVGYSYSPDFPTQNPYQGTHAGGDRDAFITKLSPAGNALLYSTYLGGRSEAVGTGIAVDSSGNAFITGATSSLDFPTQNPCQLFHGGYWDAFITKLSPSGNTLLYSTYLGGKKTEHGEGIAVDSSGNAFVTGFTSSTDFPTQNSYQGIHGGQGGYDAFITKLSPAGNTLVYSTYLGGSYSDWGYGIAVDSSGNAFVTGTTSSNDFPMQNPYKGFHAGGYDAFITKLSPSGNIVLYSTYLGGNDYDEGYGIAVDSSGNAFVTGITRSTDFPTQNPYQGTRNGVYEDAFITKLSPAGNTLVYSTYLGGKKYDRGVGIAVDSSGNAFVTGTTKSSNFPMQNPYQETHAGGYFDAFVAKLSDTVSPTITTADIKANGSDGPIVVSASTLVSIDISLDSGDKAGQTADWWIAVKTPFSPPGDWYSYVYGTGWLTGINRYAQEGLYDISQYEVLKMKLPAGDYAFYFALDDPDGIATGPWWAIDAVEVIVQ